MAASSNSSLSGSSVSSENLMMTPSERSVSSFSSPGHNSYALQLKRGSLGNQVSHIASVYVVLLSVTSAVTLLFLSPMPY
ncbi:hypothetical protein E5288_WYG014369 [Bos mutus]|uniref:Uncharacterized protein n=1 Tax=Bos mutus TaxID=72004 RepID=A0A6B0R4U3_9CETA|nr:hypothetical protein [Bos mutus]